MANIARLGVLLGLDSAEFSKGLDQANKKLYDFGKQVAANAATVATVATAAFVAAAHQALAYADGIADVAKANDVTIDSIIKLNNALAQSGGNADDAGKLLASFTNFVDSAASGSDDAQKAFTKIGISLKDLGRLSTEDLFGKAIQSIAAIEDPLTRNAKAMDMFGKAAKGVDFVALADGMNTGAGATAAQAQGLQDAADMYDRLAQSGRDFMTLLASELGPVLIKTSDYLSTLTDKGTALQDVMHFLFVQGAYQIASFATEVTDLVSVFKAWKDVAEAIADINIYSTSEDRAKIGKIIAARYADRAENEKKLAELKEQLENPFIKGVKDSEVGSWDETKPKAKRTVAPGKQATADAAAALKKQLALEQKGFNVREQERADYIKLNEHFEQGNKLLVAKQALEDQTLTRGHDLFLLNQNVNHLSEDDLQLQRDKLLIAQQYDDAVKAIRDNDALTLDAQTKALEVQVQLQQRSLDLAQQRRDIAVKAKTGTFAEGFEKEMDKAFRNLPTQMEKGQMAFESVFSNMNAALDNFVKTGKLNFKGFAQSVIQDLIAIQIKAQAVSLLKMAFGAFGFGGGGGGGGITQAMFQMAEFADGGDPPVNQASMVGERGPELFVPKTAGTIIPNHQLNLGGGGTTNNITNYNIQAIDTKSFEERILGSSKAVWAANAYGNKNLAVNRGRT
jgi:lambda family phage tail tape measure protein